MWDKQRLLRIDWRVIPIMIALMIISLLVISATTSELIGEGREFFTPMTKSQLVWFGVGWLVFFGFAGLDYHKLRDYSWVLYAIAILLLVGLFFTTPIANVRRWYRLPGIGLTLQPSEYVKLIVVITLSAFLETKALMHQKRSFVFQSLLIVGVPFLLILKQPDLGTALILFPIALVMFYFAGVHRKVVKIMSALILSGLALISCLFLGLIPHETARPLATKVLKDYQYERLNPNTYHQKAAVTAIALGGLSGSGWAKSTFTGYKMLPAAHTDSVFPAFAEEFGLFGTILILLFFFGLIYCSFQVTAVANDRFGRLLSAGIAVYIAMHVIINIGMMCGFLPITGVPLVLVTKGGSSLILTMMALGILQNIYSQRFTF